MQREVLVGILLGDASLGTDREGRKYRLQVSQSQQVNATSKWYTPFIPFITFAFTFYSIYSTYSIYSLYYLCRCKGNKT